MEILQKLKPISWVIVDDRKFYSLVELICDRYSIVTIEWENRKVYTKDCGKDKEKLENGIRDMQNGIIPTN